MLKVTRQTKNICFGVFLIFLLFQNLFGQMPDQDILDRKIQPTLKHGNIYQICAGLGSHNGLPLGFEGATDFEINEKNKLLSVEDGTLREILNSIIIQSPNYDWTIRDGVINIYPVKSRNELIKSLLETKIKKFAQKNGTAKNQIAENIYNLAEIKILLEPKQMRFNIFTTYGTYQSDDNTDLIMLDTSLLSILNRLTRDRDYSKFWAAYRDEDVIVVAFCN